MTSAPQAPHTEGPPLTTAEVAEQLGVHRKTVRRWLTLGRLRGFKLPGPIQQRWFVSQAELERIRSGVAMGDT